MLRMRMMSSEIQKSASSVPIWLIANAAPGSDPSIKSPIMRICALEESGTLGQCLHQTKENRLEEIREPSFYMYQWFRLLFASKTGSGRSNFRYGS